MCTRCANWESSTTSRGRSCRNGTSRNECGLRFAFPGDDLAKNVIQPMSRPVVNDAPDARQIGDAGPNVLETRCIGLRIGYMLDRQLRIDERRHLLRKLTNAHCLIAAEVKHLSGRG